jgi:protoheme ferro-lyase
MFVRGGMIDALVMLALSRPVAKPAIAEYLESFFSADIEKPDVLWGSWAFAVADLGLARLEPQVRQAFEREWISPEEADFEFFQEQMRSAIENGSSRRFHQIRNTKPIENAIDELSGWYCFSDAYAKEAATPSSSASTLSHFFADTFERDAPKAGRNDPCPCGSGKKFKKCCLH